jgi:hypothetical protein
MSKQKKNGTVSHAYPDADSISTRTTYQDRARFAAHPEAESFLREYVPGEFEPTPEGVDLSTVTHVLVKRINTYQQARVALTKEGFEKVRAKEAYRITVE